MERETENKVVVVTRKTRLEELTVKYNTVSQAKFYVEHLGADFSDYVAEHDTYRQCVRQATSCLERIARVQIIDRSFLPNFLFGPRDVVVTLGQDGLVANTLKYLEGQPLIGINPDPKRWDGVLLPFEVEQLTALMPRVWEHTCGFERVTMAQAKLNNGQVLYAVNDLFIGPKSHVSARYVIELNGQSEQHSSSGVIVSTGLGSTGWLKSLLAGAAAVSSGAYGTRFVGASGAAMPWDADYLQFTVREPFPSKTSSAALVFGQIEGKSSLRLVSQMPENGVIFSDGIEVDFLEFNSGIVAEIGIADKSGLLVV